MSTFGRLPICFILADSRCCPKVSIPDLIMSFTLTGRGNDLIHDIISFSVGSSPSLLANLSAMLANAFENAVAVSVVCGILAAISLSCVDIVGFGSMASSVVDSFIVDLRRRFGPISVNIIFIASKISIAFVY